MTHPQKQAQLRARQDSLREEINILLADGQRDNAIKHYQRKCACSVERAVAFVEEVNQVRLDTRRDELMARMKRQRALA